MIFTRLFARKEEGAVLTDNPTLQQKEMRMPKDTKDDDGLQLPHGADHHFVKKLRWLINTPPECPFVRMEVSPFVAEEALRYLPGDDAPFVQRPQSATTVEKYAEIMTRSEWRETLVPVIFTESAYLGDGQHRMRAVLLSGVTIPFWFAFGDKDENFFVYDNNKVRGPGDIFAIKRVPNHTMAAAATKWVAAYEAQTLHPGGTQEFARGVGTPEQTYNFYLEHVGLQDSMRIGHAMAANRMPRPSLMVALHYIAAQKNRDTADKFFLRLATGLGFDGRNDPVYKLREHITKTSPEGLGRNIAVLVVDAWNAVRARKPFKVSPRDTGGHFPRMI